MDVHKDAPLTPAGRKIMIRFVLLPGQRFATAGMAPLIDGIEFGPLIANKAFDSNAFVADLNKHGARTVISRHPRRTKLLTLDTEMYK
jgi:hypothetical protein